jgi:hypothetical protein
MSSHDRKLLQEFYRDFPVVVIELGGDRAIAAGTRRDILISGRAIDL